MNIIYPAGVPCDTRKHTHMQTHTHLDPRRHHLGYGNKWSGSHPLMYALTKHLSAAESLSAVSPPLSAQLLPHAAGRPTLRCPRDFEAHFRLKSCTPLPFDNQDRT